jgi:lipopolysaccharide transport system ATP-binding protein
MTEPAIEIQGLGKQYQLGGAEARYLTFRDMLISSLLAPFKKLRRLGGKDEQAETIWALKDITFNVGHGEVVGIIGRNGAGKSTLLKILSRITEPTEGRAITRGRVASLLEVGTGFHPELTGRENIYLNGSILGMRRAEIEDKFDDIVEFAESEKFLDTPVKRYSSGMYVRLAFAVAAHLEPEILVVDEVLAVGDAKFQKKCLGKMGEVAGQGRTVLFVSHNMTAVRRLCKTGVLLRDGRIEQMGAVDDVVTHYLDSVEKQELTAEWSSPEEAPGNDAVRLKRVALVVGPDKEELNVDTPFKLEFEVWNFKPREAMNFSLIVSTADNMIVFNSGSKPTRVGVGVFAGECEIPAGLLNDETYLVRLLAVDQSRHLVDWNDVLAFKVQEGERPGAWHGKWHGVVRPRLEWRITGRGDGVSEGEE